jgi:hypothetical protein
MTLLRFPFVVARYILINIICLAAVAWVYWGWSDRDER